MAGKPLWMHGAHQPAPPAVTGPRPDSWPQLHAPGQDNVHQGSARALSSRPSSTAVDRCRGSMQAHQGTYTALRSACAGPCIGLDTACSSSLVACHLAHRGLLDGETSAALASGINLMLVASTSTHLAQLGALSPDGRSKSFDAAANGYGRGEACVSAVLRLPSGQRGGQLALAVMLGAPPKPCAKAAWVARIVGTAPDAVQLAGCPAACWCRGLAGCWCPWAGGLRQPQPCR